MKLLQLLGLLFLLGILGGCVMNDAAGERSWTIGLSDAPIAKWALTADAGDLETTAVLDPTAVVPWAVKTVKGWIVTISGKSGGGSGTVEP